MQELPCVEAQVSTSTSKPDSKGDGSQYAELAIRLVPVAAVIEGVVRVLIARIRADAAQVLTLTDGETSLHLTGPLDESREAAVKAFVDAVASRK